MKILKKALLIQMAAESFQTHPKFDLQWSSQNSFFLLLFYFLYHFFIFLFFFRKFQIHHCTIWGNQKPI